MGDNCERMDTFHDKSCTNKTIVRHSTKESVEYLNRRRQQLEIHITKLKLDVAEQKESIDDNSSDKLKVELEVKEQLLKESTDMVKDLKLNVTRLEKESKSKDEKIKELDNKIADLLDKLGEAQNKSKRLERDLVERDKYMEAYVNELREYAKEHREYAKEQRENATEQREFQKNTQQQMQDFADEIKLLREKTSVGMAVVTVNPTMVQTSRVKSSRRPRPPWRDPPRK